VKYFNKERYLNKIKRRDVLTGQMAGALTATAFMPLLFKIGDIEDIQAIATMTFFVFIFTMMLVSKRLSKYCCHSRSHKFFVLSGITLASSASLFSLYSFGSYISYTSLQPIDYVAIFFSGITFITIQHGMYTSGYKLEEEKT
jgi:hypothetical protein